MRKGIFVCVLGAFQELIHHHELFSFGYKFKFFIMVWVLLITIIDATTSGVLMSKTHEVTYGLLEKLASTTTISHLREVGRNPW